MFANWIVIPRFVFLAPVTTVKGRFVFGNLTTGAFAQPAPMATWLVFH